MPKFSLAVVISIPALFHGLSLSALAGNELPSWLSNLKDMKLKRKVSNSAQLLSLFKAANIVQSVK